MSGTIIENLSGRKFAVLVTILVLCQVICILIGGIIAPVISNVQNILATVCEDTSSTKNDTTNWFYNHGEASCKNVDLENLNPEILNTDIVFAVRMPVPRENKILEYSRWQQKLIGVLQLDISYNSQMKMKQGSFLTVDARLAYRNKEEPKDEWKLYSESVEKRHLDCDIELKTKNDLYNCRGIPLFELGSLYHDYYLLNLRLSVDSTDQNNTLRSIQDLWLTVINQNENFTKAWVSLKTVFFILILGTLIWYGRRLYKLNRNTVLLEKMLFSVGVGMCILNIPLEYLTLYFNLQFMLLMTDIRQGVFYAKLFSFWLVFAGEHMLIREVSTQRSLLQYWRYLIFIVIGGISLFIMDMYKRGIQFRKPFYSIWATDFATSHVVLFIIVAAIAIGIYYLLLCYMVLKSFKSIAQKRQFLSTIEENKTVRHLHYQGVVYRFKFVMVATLLCAALTLSGIILGQLIEGHWRWPEFYFEYSPAFFTGLHGMWNIYIFALLVWYAPSFTASPFDNTHLYHNNVSLNKNNETINPNQ